ARADVEPCLGGLDQRAQHVERRFVRAPWVRAKVGRDGCIEVSGRGAFTYTLGLLTIGADAFAPGLGRACGAGTKDIGHALTICRHERATRSEGSVLGRFRSARADRSSDYSGSG